LKPIDFTIARNCITPYIKQTPVSYDSALNLYFKWENQQYTGSFKLRSILNKILNLTLEQQNLEIITASSGNFGVGLAYVAEKFGLTTRIFIPEYTSSSKVAQIKRMGAIVEQIPGVYQDVENHAKFFATQINAIYLSSYNDWDMIYGNGTITLEWFEQTPKLSQLLIPLGSGALLSGMALAARYQYPNIKVIGIQAIASPYLHHQFHYGYMEGISQHMTIMEGLAGAPETNAITIDLISQLCDDVILLDDDDVERAIAYAYHKFGEIVEASGAVGLAAVLANKVSTKKCTTGVIISGGNIDSHTHSALLQSNTDNL